MKNENILCTSDWHFRKDTPICRTDDFFETQIKTLKQIRDIALEHNAIIIHGGDIFHRARPRQAQILETYLFNIFKDCEIIFIPGNHDLKNNNEQTIETTSDGVISKFENWTLLQKPTIKDCLFYFAKITDFNFGMFHKYCEKEKLPPFMNGIIAKDLLPTINNDYEIDLIVCGDNHHHFSLKLNNQTLINPGCITRQTANMKDYQPVVYLYNINTKETKTINLLDNDVNVVSVKHLTKQNERDNRIDTYINSLDKNMYIELSFEDNIKDKIIKNKISKKIAEKIYLAMGVF